MSKLRIALIGILVILFVCAIFIGLFYYYKSIEKSELERAFDVITAINVDNVRETDGFFAESLDSIEVLAEILGGGEDSLFQADAGGKTGVVIQQYIAVAERVSLDGILPTEFASHCMESYLRHGVDYIALANPDGDFYLSDYEGTPDVTDNALTYDCYAQAMRERTTLIEYSVSPRSGKETLVIVSPVLRNGLPVAGLIISLFRHSLTELVENKSWTQSDAYSVIIDQDYRNITDYKCDFVRQTVEALKQQEQGGPLTGPVQTAGAIIRAGELASSGHLSNGSRWRIVTVAAADDMFAYLNLYEKRTQTLIGVTSGIFVIIAVIVLTVMTQSTRKKYTLEMKQKLILGKFKKFNFEYDAKTANFYFWPETRQILGLPKEYYKTSELISEGFVYPADKEKISGYWAELREKGEIKFEIMLRNSKHLSVEMYHLVSEKDKIDDYFGFVEDVTSIVVKQQLLEKRAMTDGLTKLRNREAAINEIEQDIKDSPHTRKALYIIDIDEFKQINDRYRHYVGDIVLQKVANALDGLVNENGLVTGRLGGDEFCVFAKNMPTMQGVKQLGQQICNKLSMLTISDDIDYFIGCSVGISTFPRNGMDFAELHQCADNALYEAKEILGSCYVLYGGGIADSENNLKPPADIPAEPKEDNYSLLLSQGDSGIAELKQLLTTALKNNEFEAYLQPMISVRDGVIAAETLARWNTPAYGMLNPNKFVQLFEKAKIIDKLDIYMLEHTFREIAARLARNRTAVNTSVNQSMQTILQPYYITKISELIKEYGSGITEYVTIEITERGLFTGLRTIIKVISRLHDLGFRISIDDFGSGYTTLSILKDLEVDEIKLDKSFISMNGQGNAKSNIIVKQIITMAHELNIKVVVEGVETFDQALYLIGAGVDCLQGFYLGRSMPTEAFYRRLDGNEFVSVDKIAK